MTLPVVWKIITFLRKGQEGKNFILSSKLNLIIIKNLGKNKDRNDLWYKPCIKLLENQRIDRMVSRINLS